MSTFGEYIARKNRVKMPIKILRHLTTYSNSFNVMYEACNTGEQGQIFQAHASLLSPSVQRKDSPTAAAAFGVFFPAKISSKKSNIRPCLFKRTGLSLSAKAQCLQLSFTRENEHGSFHQRQTKSENL
jgi:hypothetical protein